MLRALEEGRVGDFLNELRQHPEVLTSVCNQEGDPLLAEVIEYAPEDQLPEIMAWLLDMGGDPNLHHHLEGVPALYVAAVQRRVDIVELLLARGADPNLLLFDEDDPVTVSCHVETDYKITLKELKAARNRLGFSIEEEEHDIKEKERAVQEYRAVIHLLNKAGAKSVPEILGEEPVPMVYLEDHQLINPDTGTVTSLTDIRPTGPYGVVMIPLQGIRDHEWLAEMGLDNNIERLLRGVRYSNGGKYRFKHYEKAGLDKLVRLDLVCLMEDENGLCAVLSRGGAEWLIERSSVYAQRRALLTAAFDREAARLKGLNADRLPLEARDHNITEERVCYYCERDMDLDTGPEAFLAGTDAVVCWDCVCIFEPELVLELEDAKARFFLLNNGPEH